MMMRDDPYKMLLREIVRDNLIYLLPEIPTRVAKAAAKGVVLCTAAPAWR